MWKQEYEKTFEGVTVQEVWQAWEDVKTWPIWDQELESTELLGPFSKGSTFSLKAKGAPKVKIELLEVEPNQRFLDVTRFPLAQMYDLHEVLPVENGIKIRNKIWVTGPLGFLWKKIVAKGVADGVPTQTESLIQHVKNQK